MWIEFSSSFSGFFFFFSDSINSGRGNSCGNENWIKEELLERVRIFYLDMATYWMKIDYLNVLDMWTQNSYKNLRKFMLIENLWKRFLMNSISCQIMWGFFLNEFMEIYKTIFTFTRFLLAINVLYFYFVCLSSCVSVCGERERERERERNKESILNTSYKQTLIGCRKLISVLWIKAW